VFSLKLTARPDARMVEVPLEIEAELPREFEGSAVLASSGLPRRVRIRATKDALKLSTAYRADQLAADIVRTALRGTSSDVQRVQEAVMKFVRAVRDRRQDGATLVVSTNGRGKIDVVELVGSSKPPPPAPVQPFDRTQPFERPQSRPPAAAPVVPDRLPLLEKRVADLEAALARLRTGGDLVERIAQLEQKLAPAMVQISRTLGSAEIAGPGLENHAVQAAARNASSPRRTTAVEAYAEGLRSELRAKAAAAAERARAEVERCDRAAALAVDAELLGVPQDGTAQRLRDASGQVAARQTALTRLADEIEFYGGAELPVAAQLLARLEEPVARDPAPALEPVAQAIVRAAKDDAAGDRASWLQRTAALCGWHLVAPSKGDPLLREWHQPVDAGGETVVALVCPGLKRGDGTPIVEARVKVDPGLAAHPPQPEPGPPAPAAVPEAPPAVATPVPPAVEALAAVIASAPEPPAAAVPVSAAPPPSALPAPSPVPFALLPAHVPGPLPFAEAAGESAIRPDAATAATLMAARAIRIVADDPAMNDEGLAAQMAAEPVEAEVIDAHGEEIQLIADPLPNEKPTS